jgi:hypothetical protein
MAKRHWKTKLADQFEGGVSTEKALLDIKIGIADNLIHEGIGLWNSATIKSVKLLDSISGTAILAIDRVPRITWKDYKPIAEGKEVITPHTGGKDTFR